MPSNFGGSAFVSRGGSFPVSVKVRRALGKWMQAGVMEEGVISYPERGSPQGGVVTPPTMLQNIV